MANKDKTTYFSFYLSLTDLTTYNQYSFFDTVGWTSEKYTGQTESAIRSYEAAASTVPATKKKMELAWAHSEKSDDSTAKQV